jgi:hypothetical protein
MGQAMGQIPIVGAMFQMINQNVAAGYQIKSQRLSAFRNVEGAYFRQANMLHQLVSPTVSGGWGRRKGQQGMISPANFSPAERIGLLASFAGATGGALRGIDPGLHERTSWRNFKRGGQNLWGGKWLARNATRIQDWNPLVMAARGFGPESYGAGQLAAPGQGLPWMQTAGGGGSRGMGIIQSILGGATLADLQAKMIPKVGGVQATFTPMQIQRYITEGVEYLKQMATKGIEIEPGAFFAQQISLHHAFQKIFDRAGQNQYGGMTPYSLIGPQLMGFRREIQGQTEGGGPIQMATFLGALQQGMSVPEAFRAMRLGVGSGTGQVSLGNFLGKIQNLTGKGGAAFDMMDVMLMQSGGFQTPNFAAAARRLRPEDITKATTVNYEQGLGALNLHATRQTRRDWGLVAQEYADARSGRGLVGQAVKDAQEFRKVADVLVKTSSSGWGFVVQQMKTVTAITKGIFAITKGVLSFIQTFTSSETDAAIESAIESIDNSVNNMTNITAAMGAHTSTSNKGSGLKPIQLKPVKPPGP